MLVPMPIMTTSQHVVNTNNLQWINASVNQKIKNAVIAGNNSQDKVKICHAKYNNAMYPGHLTNKGCVITYAQQVKIMLDFQVLTVQDPNILVWQASLNRSRYSYAPFYGVLPENSQIDNHIIMPIIGGYESESPNYLHALYICRGIYQNNIIVGKIVNDKCNIAADGQEQSLSSYQILGMRVKRPRQ